MSRAIEAFRAARKRINPDGLAVSAGLSITSPSLQIPVAAGITYGIHEFGQSVDADFARILVVGMVAVVNGISIAAETNALRSHNYSASPIPTTFNVLTEKPLMSSITGHIINNAQLMVLNPVNSAALVTGNHELLVDSASATSLALTTWFITMNTIIYRGKMQPVVDKIHDIRQSIVKKVKK